MISRLIFSLTLCFFLSPGRSGETLTQSEYDYLFQRTFPHYFQQIQDLTQQINSQREVIRNLEDRTNLVDGGGSDIAKSSINLAQNEEQERERRYDSKDIGPLLNREFKFDVKGEIVWSPQDIQRNDLISAKIILKSLKTKLEEVQNLMKVNRYEHFEQTF